MERAITRFRQDDDAVWIAELNCGHSVHLRHEPPWQVRAWVLSDAERDARIGSALDCVRCDRREMPDKLQPYRRTRTFDENSTPAGLRAQHTTKAGVWARIHVLDGRLRYCIAEHEFDTVLEAGEVGVVVPELAHHVEPLGPVQFYVEFYRRKR